MTAAPARHLGIWLKLHALRVVSLPGGVGNNGAERLKYFKKVVAAPSLSRTGWAFDWSGLKEGNTWLALITFLYVDFFDCTGARPMAALNCRFRGFVSERKLVFFFLLGGGGV